MYNGNFCFIFIVICIYKIVWRPSWKSANVDEASASVFKVKFYLPTYLAPSSNWKDRVWLVRIWDVQIRLTYCKDSRILQSILNSIPVRPTIHWMLRPAPWFWRENKPIRILNGFCTSLPMLTKIAVYSRILQKYFLRIGNWQAVTPMLWASSTWSWTILSRDI